MKPEEILPVGTMLSGYADPSLGPFKCANCVHKDLGPPFHCDHPMVRADVAVPHDDDGHALIEPEACCTYYRPDAKKGK